MRILLHSKNLPNQPNRRHHNPPMKKDPNNGYSVCSCSNHCKHRMHEHAARDTASYSAGTPGAGNLITEVQPSIYIQNLI